MAGRFIVIEGGDGAGKSTQIDLLAAQLRRLGRPVVLTREPGGTELGRSIRQLLLHGGEISPQAEALLYAADRAEHVEAVIRPALLGGAIVLSDRHLDSSIAYQVEGRGLAEAQVRAANALAVGGLRPDLTVLLDLPAVAGAARLGERESGDRPGGGLAAAGPVDPEGGGPDRIERAGISFHERVNGRYRALAQAGGSAYFVIDARGEPQSIHHQIWAALRPFLESGEVVQ